ncbi:hypothetical protein QM267_16315, partial [Acinetobacter baumannii]|nr:hypothetical protein [Acinetobacter baumannii]
KHDGALSQLPSIVGSQALLFIRDIEKYKRGEIALDNRFFNMINALDALTLTELLLEYAMYKKV